MNSLDPSRIRRPVLCCACVMLWFCTLTGIAHAQSQAFAPEGYVDQSALWNPAVVPVCWESVDPAFVAHRGWVQDAVTVHIVQHSNIQFTGWGPCETNAGGLRIRIADERPRSGVGRQWVRSAADPTRVEKDFYGIPKSLPTQMVLNFTFQAEHEYTEFCVPKLEHCVRAIAVHEFLHAVGFLHEHLRPDADPACAGRVTEAADFQGYRPLTVGAYDSDSIMNYCANMYREPIRLSAGDLAVLNAFYRKQ